MACLHEECKRARTDLYIDRWLRASQTPGLEREREREREREKVLLLSTVLVGKSDEGNLAGDVRSVRAGHHMNVES
jgi:hypothetical protein